MTQPISEEDLALMRADFHQAYVMHTTTSEVATKQGLLAVRLGLEIPRLLDEVDRLREELASKEAQTVDGRVLELREDCEQQRRRAEKAEAERDVKETSCVVLTKLWTEAAAAADKAKAEANEAEAEVEQLKAEFYEGFAANLPGWRAFRDAVCNAVGVTHSWSTSAVEAIYKLRKRAEDAEAELGKVDYAEGVRSEGMKARVEHAEASCADMRQALEAAARHLDKPGVKQWCREAASSTAGVGWIPPAVGKLMAEALKECLCDGKALADKLSTEALAAYEEVVGKK